LCLVVKNYCRSLNWGCSLTKYWTSKSPLQQQIFTIPRHRIASINHVTISDLTVARGQIVLKTTRLAQSGSDFSAKMVKRAPNRLRIPVLHTEYGRPATGKAAGEDRPYSSHDKSRNFRLSSPEPRARACGKKAKPHSIS